MGWCAKIVGHGTIIVILALIGGILVGLAPVKQFDVPNAGMFTAGMVFLILMAVYFVVVVLYHSASGCLECDTPIATRGLP